MDDIIGGVVITFADITIAKRAGDGAEGLDRQT